jgi:hypothetical protein
LNPAGIFGTDRPHHVDAPEFTRWLALGLGKIHPYDVEKSKTYWMRDFHEHISKLKGMISWSGRRGLQDEVKRYQKNLLDYYNMKVNEYQTGLKYHQIQLGEM